MYPPTIHNMHASSLEPDNAHHSDWTVERRVLVEPGCHKRQWVVFPLHSKPQLTARPVQSCVTVIQGVPTCIPRPTGSQL